MFWFIDLLTQNPTPWLAEVIISGASLWLYLLFGVNSKKLVAGGTLPVSPDTTAFRAGKPARTAAAVGRGLVRASSRGRVWGGEGVGTGVAVGSAVVGQVLRERGAQTSLRGTAGRSRH